MSRKQIPVDEIVSELRGQSRFFPTPDSVEEDEEQSPEVVSPSQPSQKQFTSAIEMPVERSESSTPNTPSSSLSHSPAQPSNGPPRQVEVIEQIPDIASTLASNQASLLASYHASIIDAIRKTVKIVGKEVTFVRLTQEEKNKLSDIVYTYKRQGIKTSENEISRIAINFLIEDFQSNGETSILAKVLASLLA